MLKSKSRPDIGVNSEKNTAVWPGGFFFDLFNQSFMTTFLQTKAFTLGPIRTCIGIPVPVFTSLFIALQISREYMQA